MEGNNHLVHTPKMEEDKSKLQITIGKLHDADETLKLRREEKKEIVVQL
jgi:translation elongation factor EF-G